MRCWIGQRFGKAPNNGTNLKVILWSAFKAPNYFSVVLPVVILEPELLGHGKDRHWCGREFPIRSRCLHVHRSDVLVLSTFMNPFLHPEFPCQLFLLFLQFHSSRCGTAFPSLTPG